MHFKRWKEQVRRLELTDILVELIKEIPEDDDFKSNLSDSRQIKTKF